MYTATAYEIMLNPDRFPRDMREGAIRHWNDYADMAGDYGDRLIAIRYRRYAERVARSMKEGK